VPVALLPFPVRHRRLRQPEPGDSPAFAVSYLPCGSRRWWLSFLGCSCYCTESECTGCSGAGRTPSSSRGSTGHADGCAFSAFRSRQPGKTRVDMAGPAPALHPTTRLGWNGNTISMLTSSPPLCYFTLLLSMEKEKRRPEAVPRPRSLPPEAPETRHQIPALTRMHHALRQIACHIKAHKREDLRCRSMLNR